MTANSGAMPRGQRRPAIVGAGEVLWDVFGDREHFGGAPTNVAVHAAALGAEASLVSAVGRDALGDAALTQLVAAGVDSSAVARLADHPTGVVHVSIDALGMPSYEIAEDSAWDYVRWTALVERVAYRADAICFGTLAQRSLVSRATIRRAVAATHKAAWRLFDVNLRQDYYDAEVLLASLDLANAVKLNEEELPTVARVCGLDTSAPADQLRALCERCGLRLAALTRGAFGSLLVTADGEWDSPAPRTEVVDTVGAGDAFTATLLVGVLADRPLEEINQRANAVAAYVCSQPGATPMIPEELRWT